MSSRDQSWHAALCTLCTCVTRTALLAKKQQVQILRIKIGTQHSNKQAQNVYGVIKCAHAQASLLQSICVQAAVVGHKEARVVELGVLHDVELEHGADVMQAAKCCSTPFTNALCTFSLAFMGMFTHNKEPFTSQLPMVAEASSRDVHANWQGGCMRPYFISRSH